MEIGWQDLQANLRDDIPIIWLDTPDYSFLMPDPLLYSHV